MSSINRNNLEKIDNLIGKLCQNFRLAIEGDLHDINNMGANYNLYSIISNIIGSVDYYNTIHIMHDMYNPSPLNLAYLEDPINYGYINSTIINNEYIDNTNNDIYYDFNTAGYNRDIDAWTYNFPPPVPYWFHDGTDPNYNWGNNVYITSLPLNYPDWNGYPSITSGDEFPINNQSVRFPVFYLSRFIKITNNDVNPIVNSKTITFDADTILSDSMWSTDATALDGASLNYEDVRIFRVKPTTTDVGVDPDLPSGQFEEVARSIDKATNTITFAVSGSALFSIAAGGVANYVIYWRSPDISVLDFSLPTYGSTDDATDYSVDLGLYYNYFYKNRHDTINYNTTKAILKAKNKTNFDSNEINEKLYEPKDPIFYALGQLNGYIDEYNQDITYQKDFSFNYRDSYGNYYDIDSVYSVIIGVKSYFDLDTYSTIYYSYSVGPNIYPDMFPKNWEDFNYYPKLDNDYVPYIKIIVGLKNNTDINQNSPRAKIIYMDYTKSYSTRGINNIDFVNTIKSSIYDLWNSYFNENRTNLFSNIIFYTYFLILALDIDKITESQSLINIVNSHQKYIFSGSFDGLEDRDITYNYNTIHNLINTTLVSEDVSIKSDEININKINLEPWFMNVLYWKEPSEYSDTSHFDFSEGTNWVVSNSRNIDTSRTLISFVSGDITYDDQSVLLQDRDNANKIGLILKNKKLINSSKIEISFPKPLEYINNYSDSVNQDYTLKFIFKDKSNNKITKDIFIPNANYYISDDEYALKIQRSESIVGYLTPSLVWSDTNYQQYGEAHYLPNCKNATNRDILMRVFNPDDPNVKTIEEITTFCELREDPDNLRNKGGKDAQTANQDISDCIQSTIDNEGVDIVDLRTISSKINSIEEFWLGITKYTLYDPIWINDFSYLGGTSTFDPISGEFVFDPRYSFKVDGQWYYQSYNKTLVINNRNNFLSSHLLSNQIVKQQIIYDLSNDQLFSLNGSTIYLAQTFLSDFCLLTNKILSIDCWLQRVGASNATIVLKIYNTSNSMPTTLISESVGIDFNSISEDGEWITFAFSSEVIISTDITRYAIIITSIEDPVVSFSDTNKLIWKFSSRNDYSYGSSSIYSFLSSNVVAGANLFKVDDASIFPNGNFFATIDGDLYYISSIDYDLNELYFADYAYDPGFDYTGVSDYADYTWAISVVSETYDSGTMISLVDFVPLDSENRYYKEILDIDGSIVSAWTMPDYPGHDAAYRITGSAYDVGPITEPPYNEWSGDDITNNSQKSYHLDSFYITGLSAQYDATQDWGFLTGSSTPGPTSGNPGDIIGYSWGQDMEVPISGSTILGGFNVAGCADFPRQNNIRLSEQNKTDRYWAWSTRNLDYEDKIVVLPQALKNGDLSIDYIPFYNNMYLTIGLVQPNNIRKVFNKILFGYNSDYGLIYQIINNNTIVVQSNSYNTITSQQFTGKNLKFMDGDNIGDENLIVNCIEYGIPGDYLYQIELLNNFKSLPTAGDSFIISYSTIKCYEYGTLTNVSIDLATGYTTITDSLQSWTDNLYNGYTLWLIDGDTPNTSITIIDTISTDKLKFVNLLTDPSVGTRYAILSNDENEVGVYGTTSPITIDNSNKYIRMDYMYISSDSFPSDYMDGMGYNDSFLIRSKIEANI